MGSDEECREGNMSRYQDDWDGEPSICDTCHNVFTKKFASQATCYACWSKTDAGMAWKRRKEAAYAKTETEYKTVYKNLPDFDKTMVRKLLQLCHPDKHDQSELSVKVTQWLNDRMKEL